jgi:hypothetical protein
MCYTTHWKSSEDALMPKLCNVFYSRSWWGSIRRTPAILEHLSAPFLVLNIGIFLSGLHTKTADINRAALPRPLTKHSTLVPSHLPVAPKSVTASSFRHSRKRPHDRL